MLTRFLGGIKVAVDDSKLALGGITGGLSITLVLDGVITVGFSGSLLESQVCGDGLGVGVGLTSGILVGLSLLLVSEGLGSVMLGSGLAGLLSMHAGSGINLASGCVSFGIPCTREVSSSGCSAFLCGRLGINGRLEVGLGSSELALGLVDLAVEVGDFDGLSSSGGGHGSRGLRIRLRLRGS